ncbi:unnamed protein product [Adineta steineri]|uniref:Uncharacterized protein n=1 Tax=Adineta steineri TaxID=433720 RepID=A0A814ZTB5_9BILA|nr:unnamed protein product [Adineta steineri]CAF1246009.1 unnamed protein product [Adineta steineri]
MATIANYSQHFTSAMPNYHHHHRWSKPKQSTYMKRKNFRRHDYNRFRGNRQDPLNLNELIQNKNQQQQQSTINNDHIDVDIYGNDRPIEILLPPNIFDPLNLDISSYNNENSISFNSIKQQKYIPKIQTHFQSTEHKWNYDHQVPKRTMIR